MTTGLDLIEILDLEMHPDRFCARIHTEQGNLIQMGKECDIFVVYLNEKMVTNSTFEVYNNKDAGTSAASSLLCRSKCLTLLLLICITATAFEFL